MEQDTLDILAIAAHRDDAEQTCGGTLLKMAELGHRTGILDLTQGEMGTRGTADDRAREAAEAAKLLKVSWRQALDIPDGRVENTWENRLKVARVLRQTRPRVVILPYWQGRHPDHYNCSTLGYEACFLAGLSKLDISAELEKDKQFSEGQPSKGHGFSRAVMAGKKGAALAAEGKPHRPFKLLYATLYFDIRPTFIVDITEQFEARMRSIFAYRSQYEDQEAGKADFPRHDEIRARVESMARFYGMMAGVTYGEPFLQKEVGLVEDLTLLPVKSL